MSMRTLFFSLIMVSHNLTLFDFSQESSLRNWAIINDGVMGGLSRGQLKLSPEGYGKFSGTVSLANNGGFTSIRCNLPPTAIPQDAKISLRIKGDGKAYQFRVRHKPMAYQSYIYDLTTSGEWETIEFPIAEMYPQRYGRKLNMPNFNHEKMCEFTFLIANKRNEEFELLIDQVHLTN
jgi:NADH dehydrogenase [ubiquinone] 1 alpha subcomplex assembly factor 1